MFYIYFFVTIFKKYFYFSSLYAIIQKTIFPKNKFMKKRYIIPIIISLSLVIFLRFMIPWSLEESYNVKESHEYNDIKRIDYFASGSYVLVDKDEKWYSISRDWVETKKYEDISNIKFYNEGKNYSFVAKIEWKSVFVKLWYESQKYDQIYDFDISKDGEKFIFSASKEWKKILVINWFESQDYDVINDIDISETLENYSFNTFIVRKDNNYLLIKDWVEQKIIQEKGDKYIYFYGKQKFEYDFINSIRIVKWGNSFIFSAKKADKYVVVKDGKEIWTYDNIIYSMNNNIMSDFDVSPDKNSYTFIAEKNKKQILVKDWFESEKYDKIGNLIINSSINIPIKTVNHICYGYINDAQNYIFKAESEGKSLVVKDWVESEKYEEISDVNCYWNTKNYSYTVEKSGINLLINNWISISENIKKNINYLDKKDYIFNDWFYSYIVINWVKSKKYTKISWFKYFNDWKWFSFVTETNKGQKVISYIKK